MSPRVVRVFSTVALGYTLTLLPVLCAADESNKDPAPKSLGDQKLTDWSNYVYVADVVGEIVKADGNKLVLRVTWFETQNQTNNNNRNNNRNNRRPPLSRNNRNYRNPYASNMNRPKTVTKEEHHDYELEFVPETLIRNKHLPAKTDEKGVRVNQTQAELDELRAPAGAPWYAASPVDLVPGTIVEVIIIRDKKIRAENQKEGDLRVKYAIILGKDPNPPKDITNPPKPATKTKK
ncbi:MAG: hypothetical protein C0467_23960 [Planctomycetaceae bacterium]|nr:hypothetical protein [Planctomycetaceae bacterium]